MPGTANPRRGLTALVGAIVAAASVLVVTASPARAATAITINGASGGRALDGVGAVSGGGGNSRLLIDYPEPQRSDILNYLFKPGYGAAMQILKVEIGGDTNSTSGAEPSHEHVRGSVNCNRGYEWWLMEQAKARNPNLTLVGLVWGAPGWIGNGNFWTNDSIDYLIAWLGCATSHGLTIDYLGGWNEKGYNATWYKNLRSALNSRGYSAVKIVAGDNFGWGEADESLRDPAFGAAVSVFGSHYVCGYRSAQSNCPSSGNAVSTGKPLWASENGSDDYNAGAQALARGINRGYLDGKMTAYINWPVIAAITPNIPFPTMGVATATQPWSGAYAVGKNAWVIAHTTQFTAPGWRYLDSASGFLGGNRANGSFVTLRSPTTSTYSTVIETMDATAAQTFTATVTGGLSTGAVHVWSTTVSSTNPASFFVHSSDVTPSNGTFTVTLQPGTITTLTTGTGQGKGTATSPATAAFALPYSDTYDSYAVGAEARFLADMQGAFEVVTCGGSHTGRCVRQMSPRAPITWDTLSDPYALLGDVGWSNYKVSSDVLLEQAGYVELIGRAGTQHAFALGVLPGDAGYVNPTWDSAWHEAGQLFGVGKHSLIGGIGEAVKRVPHRYATLFDKNQDPNGPQSVVGIGQLSGSILAAKGVPLSYRVWTLVSIVASVNFFVGVINLLPFLPFDGGHIAASVYDRVRGSWRRRRGREAPGIASSYEKYAYVSYPVFAIIFVGSLLTLASNIANPIHL